MPELPRQEQSFLHGALLPPSVSWCIHTTREDFWVWWSLLSMAKQFLQLKQAGDNTTLSCSMQL